MQKSYLPRCLLFDDQSNLDRPFGVSINIQCFDELVDEIVNLTDHVPLTHISKVTGLPITYVGLRHHYVEIEYARAIHDSINEFVLCTWRPILSKNNRRTARTPGMMLQSSARQLQRVLHVAEKLVEKDAPYQFAKSWSQIPPSVKREIAYLASVIDPFSNHIGSPWRMLFASGVIPLSGEERNSFLFRLRFVLRSIIERHCRNGRPIKNERDIVTATIISEFCRLSTGWNSGKPLQPIEPTRLVGGSERHGPVVNFMKQVERIYGLSFISHHSGSAWTKANRLAAEKLRVFGAD